MRFKPTYSPSNWREAYTDVDEPIFINVIALVPGGGAAVGIPLSDLHLHVVSDNHITSTSESWIAFGEVSYNFTKRLTGALGLRYFEHQTDWINDEARTTNPILPGQLTSIVPVRPRMLGVEFRARF